MFKEFLEAWLVFIVGVLFCYGLILMPLISYLLSFCIMVTYFALLFHNSYKTLFLIDYFNHKNRFKMYLHNRKYYRACGRLKEKFPQITKIDYKIKLEGVELPHINIYYDYKGHKNYFRDTLMDNWSNYYRLYEKLSEQFKKIDMLHSKPTIINTETDE